MGSEGLEFEVCVDGIRLEHVSNLNTWDVFWTMSTDEANCSRKMESGRRVAGAIRSLVNARSLYHECVRVLHESLLVSVFTYDTETMIWRKKARYSLRVVQMDSLRGLLGIRIMDKAVLWSDEVCVRRRDKETSKRRHR